MFDLSVKTIPSIRNECNCQKRSTSFLKREKSQIRKNLLTMMSILKRNAVAARDPKCFFFFFFFFFRVDRTAYVQESNKKGNNLLRKGHIPLESNVFF